MRQGGWSQDLYVKAYLFAARAHRGQTVPGTDLPYVTHVSLVSMEVLAALSAERGHDEDLALQCALLHDVLEDTSVTYAQLVEEFGRAVADAVRALSKDPSIPKHLRMNDSLRRIRQQRREVWMVKLADRITNLQPPPPHWTEVRIARYRDEAIEIHRALGEASEVLSSRLLLKIEEYGRGAGQAGP
ncbi:MAG: bifunctional (p)ppGpp synthetase/guanosine-3',5'-bis(diphosphate) 3'-pyrophosphohydrolase [Anaerolineae bacterium]|nr:bifunctional (p)ppGpp synthetase/guanosine-3',5'-bis(diphosphate) 3'-pyrophosphohydrolase [Anaerolineae bacterium]